ncbi:hypothetical protein T439DRAFT_321112 [Meredithblackwellia eburnea MCA 4105]
MGKQLELPTTTITSLSYSNSKNNSKVNSKQQPWRASWSRWLIVALASFAVFNSNNDDTWNAITGVLTDIKYKVIPLPKDPLLRAKELLKRFPLIDGHLDVPILARAAFLNNINEIDLEKPTRGQVDIPRLRKGGVGGFFWSVYVPCPDDAGYPADNYGNFTTPTWRTRDTLEQIDIAHLMIQKHSDTFEFTPTAKSWRKALKNGKIGGMLGVEGGHQLGNTLSALRTYYSLGARYVTLTHTCHNAIADSCGYQSKQLKPRWGGLSPFGKTAIKEMNRLGMIIDLSHTDPSTASDALSLSLSPPIFSHSNARGVHSAVRNVPDSILRRIGKTSSSPVLGRSVMNADGEGGLGWGNDTGEADKPVPSGDSIIMLNFSPDFISEWSGGEPGSVRANVSLVADHADYIGQLAGREHVGIGSDFDGIARVPEGLEDTSKYPSLIAELIKRGWTDSEIAGLTSGNILRIIEKTEQVAWKLRNEIPETEIFEGRTDMVRREW